MILKQLNSGSDDPAITKRTASGAVPAVATRTVPELSTPGNQALEDDVSVGESAADMSC